MKINVKYKCRLCGKVFSNRTVATIKDKTAKRSSFFETTYDSEDDALYKIFNHHKCEHPTFFHKCDDSRYGLGDFIGVTKCDDGGINAKYK